MAFFGLLGGEQSNLVVVLYEGPEKLRLNGNRMSVRRGQVAKQNAASHKYTVCWIEFSQGGARLDQGVGPAGVRLGPGQADRLLKDLSLNSICREMLHELETGHERCARILSW